MKLYFYSFVMVLRRFLLRQSTGDVVYKFATRMGVVYIKLAQILAMQNIGQVFTEDDRRRLAKICDHCNPIPFAKIQREIEKAYGCAWWQVFKSIDPEPLGSASMSQVHRATLKSGEEVVIKVKRKDVTRRIDHDIKQARRLIHRFGHLASFKNFLGSDQALELYMQWIVEETDFEHERRNILRYREFAESVNGKISHAVDIKAPELYEEYCTPNIIVMEYIKNPTANQLEPNEANNNRLGTAINDYVRLSFYALLHDQPVVFHGDPHSGNIYLDEYGNVGFLDFGLIFEFTPSEAEFIRKLFLNSYSGKVDELVELIVSHSKHTDFDRLQLTDDIRQKVARFHEIPVTQYFIEMINVFTQYNISPPEILFKMAKAFLALFGINNFIANSLSTEALLAQQVTEYYLETLLGDFNHQILTAMRGIRDVIDFWQQARLFG